MGRKDPEMQRFAEVLALCEALHCLPREGGLFDQDPYWVLGMEAVLIARYEEQKREQEKNASRHA
jgi:hypothetical protein